MKNLSWLLLIVLLVACKPPSIEEIIADPSYVKECREINSTIQKEKAGYMNLFPGVSTPQQVVQEIGEPERIDKSVPYHSYADRVDAWAYDSFSLYFKEDALKYISIYSEEEALTLEEIVKKYGCPEIIVHHYFNDMNIGGSLVNLESFNFVTLAIPSIGIEFSFDGFPISLEKKPYHTFITEPLSLQEFLSLEIKGEGEVVSWSDAVK